MLPQYTLLFPVISFVGVFPFGFRISGREFCISIAKFEGVLEELHLTHPVLFYYIKKSGWHSCPVLVDDGTQTYEFKSLSSQTNDLKIYTCCFLPRLSVSLGLDKDWLAQCQGNVTEWDSSS